MATSNLNLALLTPLEVAHGGRTISLGVRIRARASPKALELSRR